ncbi:helix-turn-helix transcriptional regulator [Pectobacterium aquaticum]|nr:helix-turn-helix transcriptional regulator [Pectobacterium aquaticum]RRO07637.1 AraC family transcriptional regulator [Pectobacterium aquaticum]
MSPLQYQKWIRLHEVRRLMLNAHLDVSSAAFNVGYESPSQFSREYRRLFGAPARKDITALREQVPPSGMRSSPQSILTKTIARTSLINEINS